MPNSNPSKKQIPGKRQKENIPQLVKEQNAKLQIAKTSKTDLLTFETVDQSEERT